MLRNRIKKGENIKFSFAKIREIIFLPNPLFILVQLFLMITLFLYIYIWCILQATVADEEILSLITINKTNFVVASVLARDSEQRELHLDFALHQNFPTLKLS